MKNKIYSVTIGIPAFNEENDIQKLLLSVLSQKNNNFILKDIIVVSDGSTDKTIEKIKNIRSKKIKIIQNNIRRGQIYCQNYIFSKANTDVVIIIEADTNPDSKYFITNLLKPIISDKKIGLVQGLMKPYPPTKLIDKILYSQFLVYTDSLVKDRVRNTIPSGRGGRAFTKLVYKKLRWPPSVPEDDYAYLWCVSKNIKTVLESKAICRFRLPKTLSDYLKETKKNKLANDKIMKLFPKDIIEKNFSIGLDEKLNNFFILLMKNPILCILYFFLKLAATTRLRNGTFTDFWSTTKSTKY